MMKTVEGGLETFGKSGDFNIDIEEYNVRSKSEKQRKEKIKPL